MTIEAGERLGPYEVVSPLGSGGMGDVWRARDTRLERSVAIKVLPEALAKDEQFRQRFEREARTVSQLNHPHICTLHDVGEEDGRHYLVMELLEGESLADRLSRGPLPLHEVLRFGSQVARALDAAHRSGITHRDLKPGNVMLTKSGAKLLDFGLAKAGSEAPVAVTSFTSLPTEARPLTERGTILGTFQYMAPEQLEGETADARTDIFALGALLYEMATGQRAFQGTSKTSLIAAIVSSQPAPVSSLVPTTPPALDHVIQRCLEKDPEDRWQSAQDVANELSWIGEAGSRAGSPVAVTLKRKTRERLAWVAATLGVLVAAGASFALWSSREPPRVVRSSLLPPEGARYLPEYGAMALSPNGQRITFVASREDEPRMLWVRSLRALTAQPLARTEGVSFPFWSPDSRFIGFFSKGKLRKIDAGGGPAQALCDAPNARGGSWSSDGTILFTPTISDVIYRVGAGGGTPVAVTAFDDARGEFTHRHPEFLPDGRHFLYLAQGKTDLPGTADGFAIFGASLDSTGSRQVVATDASARYARSGHLLFRRDRALLAQRFDPDSLELLGDAIPLAESVLRTNRWEAIFSISQTGLLAFQSGTALGESSLLVWLDRDGAETGAVATLAGYRTPVVSHDGRRIAVAITDPQGQQEDIWVLDVQRGTSTRLTFDPLADYSPRWSPDDRSVYFTSDRSGGGDLYVKSSAGTGEERLAYAGEGFELIGSLSPDGRTAWVASQSGATSFDIDRVDLETGEAEAFLGTPAHELVPRVSPDGHLLAYNSNESGRREVFVRSLRDEGGRWQISTAGGRFPVWTRGGREIVFEAMSGNLMTVDVTLEPSFAVSIPQILFDPQQRDLPGQQWDVTSDGNRFIVNRLAEPAAVDPITLVQSWVAELESGSR